MTWGYGETDPALMLFTAAHVRWEFRLPPDAVVAELGCAETDFCHRLKRENPGFTVTGVDIHAQPSDGSWTSRAGSALDPELFAPASLDAVFLLGALEHFGLGYYGDPLDEDGDTVTMRNVARWLKRGGFVYFDVPCQPTYGIRENRHFRDYAPASVQERLIVPGLSERARGYSWPEPHAGSWCDEPKAALVPYWFVAVVADKE